MLRRMSLHVSAVDNMASEYRTMWIADTVKSDGVEYLKKNGGGAGKVLLIVYNRFLYVFATLNFPTTNLKK